MLTGSVQLLMFNRLNIRSQQIGTVILNLLESDILMLHSFVTFVRAVSRPGRLHKLFTALWKLWSKISPDWFRLS